MPPSCLHTRLAADLPGAPPAAPLRRAPGFPPQAWAAATDGPRHVAYAAALQQAVSAAAARKAGLEADAAEEVAPVRSGDRGGEGAHTQVGQQQQQGVCQAGPTQQEADTQPGDAGGVVVLDVGCGSGRLSLAAAAAGAGRVVGVELCPALAAAARRVVAASAAAAAADSNPNSSSSSSESCAVGRVCVVAGDVATLSCSSGDELPEGGADVVLLDMFDASEWAQGGAEGLIGVGQALAKNHKGHHKCTQHVGTTPRQWTAADLPA